MGNDNNSETSTAGSECLRCVSFETIFVAVLIYLLYLQFIILSNQCCVDLQVEEII